LEKAAVRAQADTKDQELRDAVIQRFEYTYEISWKMMKRKIEMEAASPPSIDALSFKDLLREAAEKGLIADIEPWFEYREARNRTSHSYDEESAKQVYETALHFLEDSKLLFKKIEEKN
jgi:nucleotidyltransferase substrate binding protein (TIGR01987 family)